MISSQNELLKSYNKVNNENMDLLLDEIKEFLHLYFFKGNISKNLNKSVVDLFNISEDDLKTFKVIHFLLSDEVENLVNILPKLIRNLAHSTKKETIEYNGEIKGCVEWNQTYKTRFSRGFNDKSLFICYNPLKYYDLYENQLLKFLLNEIIFFKKKYVDFISCSEINFEKIDSGDWQEKISKNYHIVKKTLKIVYFNDISSINVVLYKHIRNTYANRNPLYHLIAKAYILYEKLFIDNDNEILRFLVEKRIIISSDPNKLYEIYIFFNLIKTLPGYKDLKLLYSGNDYSVNSKIKDMDITIYYQNTPQILKDSSQYLKILENYQIKKSVKSPDVIIEFKRNNNVCYRLVEVKNSSKTKYIRESLYKVMGYYKDFEKSDKFTSNYPIVLVVWGGINICENYNPFNDRIIILNHEEFLHNIEKIIKK